MQYLKIFTLFSFLLLLSACSSRQDDLETNIKTTKEVTAEIEKSEELAPEFAPEFAEPIKDIRDIPQSTAYFLSQAPMKGEGLLADKEMIIAMNKRFLNNFYSPWRATKTSAKKENIDSLFTRKYRGFAENLLLWTDERWEKVHTNADMENFPNTNKKAITIRATAVRELPTQSPRFSNPERNGSGYPFDLLQYATLPIGQPIFISHTSSDGAWIFIETAMLAGWIASEDAVFVDAAFMKSWQEAKLTTFIEDKVPLIYQGRFLAHGSIGTLLPYINNQIYLPVADISKNTAKIIKIPFKSSSIQSFPMEFTAKNVSNIADKLMNEPYGWGGYLGNRDCSAFLRDLYISFGVWLPRNSRPQSQIGLYVDMEELTPEERKGEIVKNATPFASFVYLVGHIGLYLGTYDDEPVFLHNIWGVRTEDKGRVIIGRLVITSLEPGKELDNIDEEGILINRIIRYNTIGKEQEKEENSTEKK